MAKKKPAPKPKGKVAAQPTGQDLGAFLSSIGIDPNSLGGGMADPSDPPVASIIPAKKSHHIQRTLPRGGSKPSSQAYLDFYRMTPQEVQVMQQKLFNAGYYGSAESNDIPWGDHDDDTFKIWRSMVDRAAGFYAVGQKLTPKQVLDNALAAAGTNHPHGPQKAPRAPLVLQTPNPDDLAAVAQEAARSTIGAKLGDDQIAAFVADFQSRVTNAQRQAYAAEETGGNIVEPPNAQTAAEQFTRQRNPQAAGAHDLFSIYGKFLSKIGAA